MANMVLICLAVVRWLPGPINMGTAGHDGGQNDWPAGCYVAGSSGRKK